MIERLSLRIFGPIGGVFISLASLAFVNFPGYVPLILDAMVMLCGLGTISVFLWVDTLLAVLTPKRSRFVLQLSTCVKCWLCVISATALVLIFLPGLIGSRSKAADNAVRQNMNQFEKILQEYALHHEGSYPPRINDDIKSFYPNGSPQSNAPGRPPLNPYTWREEWPLPGKLTNVDDARKETGSRLMKGSIEYSPIPDTKGRILGYAIRGGGRGDKALTPTAIDATGTLVLAPSMQWADSDTRSGSKH